MNIPEKILQAVADAAFKNTDDSYCGSLVCRSINPAWEIENDARRAVIQHAITNPALAPFLAVPESPALAEAEQLPAMAEPLTLIGGVPFDQSSQVPLGPEDVKPGAALKMPNWEEGAWRIVIETDKEGIWLAYVKTGAERVSYKNLFVTGAKINTSIPDTGRWDANAWRPCSKPGK